MQTNANHIHPMRVPILSMGLAISPVALNARESMSDRNKKILREGLAGSFAYVKLSLQRNGSSFLIPPVTIVTNQERKFVIRVKNDLAEWVDVRQGMSTDRGLEVFGNLANGDTLVSRATDERKSGTKAYWKVQ